MPRNENRGDMPPEFFTLFVVVFVAIGALNV